MTDPTPTPSGELNSPPSGGHAAVAAAAPPPGADTAAPSVRQPDPANPMGDCPAIYVACLASYNNGILHGAWIWAEDADAMRADTRAMLARSPEPDAEEWAIHDYAGFEGLNLSEYQSFESVADTAAYIRDHGALGAKLAEHYGGDLEDARKALEDYCGEFECLADYARDMVDQCGLTVPDYLRQYIDYDAMGRDMELGGDVIAIEMGYQSVHIFRSW